MTGKLLTFIPLVLFLFSAYQVQISVADCTYDQAVGPCWVDFMSGRSQNPNKNLDVLIQAFSNISASCNKLNTLQECVKRVTTGCRTEGSQQKPRVDKMKEVTENFCVKNVKAFTDNAQCVTDPAFKREIDPCQTKLNADSLSCPDAKSVFECVDPILDRRCHNIHDSFGEIIRMYIVNRFNVRDCTIAHAEHEHDHDHPSSGPMGVHRSVLTWVIFLLVTMLTMRP